MGTGGTGTNETAIAMSAGTDTMTRMADHMHARIPGRGPGHTSPGWPHGTSGARVATEPVG